MALVTLRQLLDHAAEHDYGVPAFNINNMEQGLAVLEAASSVDAPVIIQASRGARSYANDIMLAKMIEALISGVSDPAVLAQMAKGRMRTKLGELEEALAGHFGAHHAIL